MNERTAFRISPQFVLGVLIVIVGILFTFDNLDLLSAGDYLRYWPALLVVYGIAKLLQPETRASRFWGIVLTFVGAALLVDRLDMFYFRVWDFWPLLLVALGVLLILRARGRRAVTSDASADRVDDRSGIVNAKAIVGVNRRNVSTTDFRGGELTAVMGGCDIDLRNSAIATSPAVIDVFAFWGGIEIKVPTSWTVTFEGTPILGGCADKTFKQAADANQRLIIRGTILMGEVEVTN